MPQVGFCMQLHRNEEAFSELIALVSDYETVTKAMMFKYVPYDEAIKAISTIVESGVFEMD